MEQIQSIDSQFSKVIYDDPPQPQPSPPNYNYDIKLEPNINPNLSIEHYQHSLALSARPSIQRGIPIPSNMLSQDDIPQRRNHSEEHQDDPEQDHPQPVIQGVKLEPTQQDKQWLQQQLGLKEVIQLKKGPNNTKNVLRNFGNAQNQYILYHNHAIAYTDQKLANPQKFRKWVRGLRLQKFQDFKQVWSSDSLNLVFRRVYRELCFKFYKQSAIPYVLSSRMKNENTKLSHLRYVYRFLQGLKSPYEFSYFKKVDK